MKWYSSNICFYVLIWICDLILNFEFFEFVLEFVLLCCWYILCFCLNLSLCFWVFAFAFMFLEWIWVGFVEGGGIYGFVFLYFRACYVYITWVFGLCWFLLGLCWFLRFQFHVLPFFFFFPPVTSHDFTIYVLFVTVHVLFIHYIKKY